MTLLSLQTSTTPGGDPSRQGLSDVIERRVLECVRRGSDTTAFSVRRTRQLVLALDQVQQRVALLRALEARESPGRCAAALLALTAPLEAGAHYERAAAVADVAASLCPHDPAIDLHRARLARKAGHSEKALALYERALHSLGDDSLPLARMARLGCVLVADGGVAEVGPLIREAVRSGDDESAAVAQEARARRRIAAGDVAGAVRDLVFAAARYPDAVDRGRVGHAVADLLLARGQVSAARFVLEQVVDVGLAGQADWARTRLRQLALATHDQVGARRWAGPALSGLVALVPRLQPGPDDAPCRRRLVNTLRRLHRLSSGVAGG